MGDDKHCDMLKRSMILLSLQLTEAHSCHASKAHAFGCHAKAIYRHLGTGFHDQNWLCCSESCLVWALWCSLGRQTHGPHAEVAVLSGGAPPDCAFHSALLSGILACCPQVRAELGILASPSCALAGALNCHCKKLYGNVKSTICCAPKYFVGPD